MEGHVYASEAEGAAAAAGASRHSPVPLGRGSGAGSVAGVLAIVFASLYLAVGPGNFFSVDEVNVQETAQAVYQRGTLEIAAMPTAVRGRGYAFYGHRGPALGYAAVPFVALGNFLDDHLGSMRGGVIAGPPMGVLEQPLRWGGRLAVFTALALNAILGGLIVAMLFLIAVRMGASERAALLMACAAGASTLLMSESTHFFGHPLEALGLLLGFWFFSVRDEHRLAHNAWLGGLSLGIAILARPNSPPAAALIWLFWVLRLWRETRHKKRDLIRPILSSVIPVILCCVIYLRYNYVQFGSVTSFGYDLHTEGFAFDFWRGSKALVGYLVSPGLSIFLFAPPLLLALPLLTASLRRWPLETQTLLCASVAELLVISNYKFWHGAVAYGPRHALGSIVLLMLLTIPAFERVASARSRRWAIAAVALVAIGLFIEVVGTSVYVTVNEWYRVEHALNENGAFVFAAGASPIVVQFRDLVAGRNLIPWGLRALRSPGVALLLWSALLLGVGRGGVWLRRRYVKANGSAADAIPPPSTRRSFLAEGTVIALALVIFGGFVITRPVSQAPHQRAVQMVNEGLAAQQMGKDVTAEEDYALALGLEPSNKFAFYNLGVLYDQAGSIRQAVTLYQRVLQQDASFTPARDNLARYLKVSEVAAAEARVKAAPTAESYLNLSLQYHQNGRYQDAMAASREALKLKPDYAEAYNNIAAAYNGLAMWDEASRAAQEAMRIKPDLQLARNNLAWSLWQKKKSEDELAAAEGLAKLAPSAENYLALSLQYHRNRKYQDCIAASREALKLKPDYAEAYNNIAAAYQSMERWEEAIDAAEQALRLKPDFQVARNNLQYSLKQKRMKDSPNTEKQ